MFCTHPEVTMTGVQSVARVALPGIRGLGSNAEGTADTTSGFKWGWAGSQSHNGTARENTWLLKETAYFYDKSSLLVMWLHSSWRDPVISWAVRCPGPLKQYLHTQEWSHPFRTMSHVQLRLPGLQCVFSRIENIIWLLCCCFISSYKCMC